MIRDEWQDSRFAGDIGTEQATILLRQAPDKSRCLDRGPFDTPQQSRVTPQHRALDEAGAGHALASRHMPDLVSQEQRRKILEQPGEGGGHGGSADDAAVERPLSHERRPQ